MRAATAVALGLTVGPAFAGESVMWGEERNGATRFVLDLPAREPLLVHRIGPPTARDTDRGFPSLPAGDGGHDHHAGEQAHAGSVTPLRSATRPTTSRMMRVSSKSFGV